MLYERLSNRRYVGAWLQTVLDAMKVMKRLGIWLEVTRLAIPGINDEPAELRDAASFVAHDPGVETPWHVSRFLPAYKMSDVPPTPLVTLRWAREIGLEKGLRYVYVGNVPDEESTYCYECGQLLISRSGFYVKENVVYDGRCPKCGAPAAGVGMDGSLAGCGKQVEERKR
jgi:pyruvate formate lyase activating enzyme